MNYNLVREITSKFSPLTFNCNVYASMCILLQISETLCFVVSVLLIKSNQTPFAECLFQSFYTKIYIFIYLTKQTCSIYNMYKKYMLLCFFMLQTSVTKI